MNMTRLTEKFKVEFTKHAGEEVDVKIIGGTIYALGSELATLRLFHKYAKTPSVRQGYSVNLNTFYFCYEVPFSIDH